MGVRVSEDYGDEVVKVYEVKQKPGGCILPQACIRFVPSGANDLEERGYSC